MKADVIIIGGGASGLIAAITAKKNGKDVIILERKERVLKKVLVRAGISNYFAMGKNIDLIENVFEKFTVTDTIDFFENEIGLICNEETRGRVYPLSGQAASVVDGLRFCTEKLGITTLTDFYVRKIEKKDFKFKIYSEDKKVVEGSRVILATGGQTYTELGSNGSGYELAKSFGHSITKLVPTIVQLKTKDYQVKGLRGIKLDTKVTAYGDGNKICTYDGELLFTEYGVSGNVIFNISFVYPIHKKVELEILCQNLSITSCWKF